jgi:hypothetical protein
MPVERIPSEHARPHFLGYARNVSESGIFLQCPLPPPVGTHLSLKLNLPGPNGTLIAGSAEVRWVRDYQGWESPPAGMGVWLGGLPPSAEHAWSSFCRSFPEDD